MKKVLGYLTIVVALAGFGCNKTGVPTEFAKACVLENDKKILEIEGFLMDSGGVRCSNSLGPMECNFRFLAAPGDASGMTAKIDMGTWANEVEKLSDGYKSEDVKIHSDDGSLVKLGEKLKITGEFRASSDGKTCWIDVTKIMK